MQSPPLRAWVVSLALFCGALASLALGASPIRPADDGSYTLPAESAQLRGPAIERNGRDGAIKHWSSRKDRAAWQINSPRMGDYDVAVTWSVAEQDALQGYNIEIDDRATIRAFTVSTGGSMKREIVGRIMLAPGVHSVTFFPTSNSRGGLCQLQQIELTPVANVAVTTPPEPVEFRVPAGFEVTQVAGRPLTSHPMLACFDDRGRLYACESTGVNADASILAQSPPHEIRVLEDADGDGTFDRSTVYADKLTMPQGIVWHEGSIYTSSPPDFLRLTDADGDDVADEREVLLTGFPFRGMSDDMHGGTLGRDGRLYFAVGRFPHKISRPGGPVLSRGHNPIIVRCRPDGSDFEVVCGAMGNAVGVDFADTGECFASGTFGVNAAGRRDVLNHCVEGGAYPVLNQPLVDHKRTGGEMPNLAQFGASASSDLMIYRDEAFGPEYRGNLFSAMFNMHKIARHVLTPDGATFRCRTEDFLTSPNTDFHPTDVLEDADGSLLVVDTGAWFLIGCPTSVIAKPQISGGIYRVRRIDAPRVDDPWGISIAWNALGPGQLIERLDDSRFAVRDRAMRLLAAKEGALPALQLALGDDSPTRVRLNAIWTLSRIDSPEAAAIARLSLDDRDDGVRQAAATAAGLFRDRDAVPKLMQLVREDKSPPVRREAANALGRIGDPEAGPALLASLTGVSDRFLDHALILALIRLDDREQTIAGFDDPAPEVRRGALIALDQMDHGALTQADVTRVLESDDVRTQQTALEIISRHPHWAEQIVEVSQRWLADSELSSEGRSTLKGLLRAFAGDASIQELIARSLADETAPAWVRVLLLEVIAQSELAALPPIWRQPVLAALRSDDPVTARAAVAAIAAVHPSLEDASPLGREELLALARNDKRPHTLRVAAAEAAVSAGQTVPGDVFDLLWQQCRPAVEPVARLSAASALGSAELNDHQRQRVVELIADASPLELPALMRAFEVPDIDSVGLSLVQALENSPGRSALPLERLVKLLEKLPADVRPAAEALVKQSEHELQGQRQRLEELEGMLVDGDAERGRALFYGAKASCSACHRIDAEGGEIGPNLTGIGQIRTRCDLLEAIVFPSASFARNYEPFTVLTKAGIAHSGVISRTTSDAVYLTTGERNTIRIPSSEIEDDGVMPSNVSIMPQGLDQILQPAELQDLLAYLESLRQQQPQ